MKILIIDRDDISAQLIASRLQGDDINIVIEPSKGEATERLASENFDLVFVDPAPMKDGQAITMNLRRASRQYCYVVLMGEDIDLNAAISAGANSILKKPIDPQKLQECSFATENT
jgi:CheY-like chemotaxis protein